MMETLYAVAQRIGARLEGANAGFNRVITDTRQLIAGDLFVALNGENFDGHEFVERAGSLGAVGALVSRHVDCALPQLVAADELIDVPSVGGQAPRKLKRQELAQVIRARYEELFRLIRKELHRSDFYDVIAGGVVLTGGSAKMAGVIELAEEVFELPVRLGVPQGGTGFSEVAGNPAFATAAGLLLYGKQHHSRPTQTPMGLSALFERLQQWFKGNF